MPLDPQVQALRTRMMGEDARPLYAQSVDEARKADLDAIRAAGGQPEPVARVHELRIPGFPETETDGDSEIELRVYRPEGPGPFPVLVYFFGGGWTLGSLDTSDGVCRTLTNAVPCVTVSVGYRLAPEHKFPTAVEDCHAAVRWVAEHGTQLGADSSRLAVGGDSAGGNLAAAVTLLLRDRGGPAPSGQLLVYPNTDYGSDTPSMRENTDPVFFNEKSVDWYWRNYLASPQDGTNPLASPLRAESLAGLPPALVVTAEFDPLRDQGEQYAARLEEAGVPVRLSRYPGMIHGFFTMSGTLDASRQALAQAAAYLRTIFDEG
ncbi:alpha/beta hydrolase [Streptomyces sp. NPDC003011]